MTHSYDINEEKSSNKARREKTVPEKTLKKMPVFNCTCGAKILIVPDIDEMNKAIEEHLAEHKRITGKCLNEEFLAQKILITLAES
jgi:hypothetical protein